MQTCIESNDEIVFQVLAHLPVSLVTSSKEQLASFISMYYHQLDPMDLGNVSSEDLFGSAVSHWELLQQRTPGATVLRIYNPQLERHGWQSGHTIIELVTEDMPYLVSSLSMVIAQQGSNIHMTNHPVMRVSRDAKGLLTDCSLSARLDGKNQASERTINESIIHLEIDRITKDREIARLSQSIEDTISNIRIALDDDAAMRKFLSSLQTTYKDQSQSESRFSQSIEVLEWLNEKNLSLLGVCPFLRNDIKGLEPDLENAMGILSSANPQRGFGLESLMPSHVYEDFTVEDVRISKVNVRSPIIRPEYLDVIALPFPATPNTRNQPEADQRPDILAIVGLFTPSLKFAETASIPLLRDKTQAVMKNSAANESSHLGRALKQTLELFPRDMLFQTNTETLLAMATGIVNLQERQRIRLFGSMSSDGLYCNCLVYIPRETYGRELRLAIEFILLKDLAGISSEFDSRFSSGSTLARIHYVVQFGTPRTEMPDWAVIESHIVQAAISWDDQLLSALLNHYDEERANALHRLYWDAFPSSYKEAFTARTGQSDISFIEDEAPTDRPVIRFYHNLLADENTANFKLYSPGSAIALSDVIPIIENMGMRVEGEHPYPIRRHHRTEGWIHEFSVQHLEGKKINGHCCWANLQVAFEKIWSGQVENDGFNRLILEASIDCRQVVILRSYCKYLLQIRVPFSQSYMIDTLVANSAIAQLLITLFEQRFDPDLEGDRCDRQAATYDLINNALSGVDSLDQDRILRAFVNLVQSTVRTNYFQLSASSHPLEYVSFKIDSSKVKSLPLPRPVFEIFVYSPRVEGIHLRGGKVARGGLRWSDRREDFRTEVLGLMKAQMVKNAVIVPVGSKGGFFVKRPPTNMDRDVQLAEGIYCYQTFLRGLLDVTDNFVGNTVVPPNRVIRHDDDDPYLVVAADKGTATFSDYANEIAEAYGFWLGDAFASGGSVGYDHKKMGITARGAWESVKRHFRELGIDTQATTFTVVGIGDMGGDVFGNGMLLSPTIKLVAAFNHLHIFIDPDPDPAISFNERTRLFNLPRSSWDDYQTSVLSTGGKIYSRAAKEVVLSPEAMTVLGINESTMTPNELIHQILQAPVDLIWNGGIGTYIKTSKESHAQVSDRANDGVRVNANQLRCKVLGEGGNLGATQLGRIEFAQRGGKIYTDAIDNSAGVDCSDHEVNIKILVNSIVDNGDMTRKQRDTLLADMTAEVGELVIRDNYLQTQCISIAHAEAVKNIEEHARLISHLESANRLDREIEYLPGVDEIADRLAANKGLTQPEIAVLVSYSKMTFYADLLTTSFTNDPWLDKYLEQYFPLRLTRNYQTQLHQHRLRPQIIATAITNEVVNRLGPTFLFRMYEEMGSTPEQVAQAYVAVTEIFDMDKTWTSIESLDNVVSAAEQTNMQILVRGLVERAVHWMLRSRRSTDRIETLIELFKPGIKQLRESMAQSLASLNRDTLVKRIQYFTDAGAPPDTAQLVAEVVPLSSALDIVEIGQSQNKPVDIVAAVYFELGVFLQLQWLRDEIGELLVSTHWHTLAKSELRSDMHYQQRHLCAEVLSTVALDEASNMVNAWADNNRAGIEKYSTLINDMKASTTVDFAMLSLAVNEVHKLLRSVRPLAA